jgi:hypothetical protein
MEKQHAPKFYLFLKMTQANSRQEAKLFARISGAGRRPIEITTQLFIPIKLWDQRNQQLLQPMKHHHLQQEINKALQNIMDAHEQLSAEDFYSQKQLADFLYGKKLPATRITYKFLYQKHLEIYGDDLAPGTWKNYRSNGSHSMKSPQIIRGCHKLFIGRGFWEILNVQYFCYLINSNPSPLYDLVQTRSFTVPSIIPTVHTLLR